MKQEIENQMKALLFDGILELIALDARLHKGQATDFNHQYWKGYTNAVEDIFLIKQNELYDLIRPHAEDLYQAFRIKKN
jgi:hypothetical protein